MFQDILKTLIAQRGVSVVAMAKELGIPKTLIYEWRAGVRMPSAKNLSRLSRYFGVEMGNLLGEGSEAAAEGEADADAPEPISELGVLFRQASRLSPDDQMALARAMRENLKGYLYGDKEGDTGAGSDGETGKEQAE